LRQHERLFKIGLFDSLRQSMIPVTEGQSLDLIINELPSYLCDCRKLKAEDGEFPCLMTGFVPGVVSIRLTPSKSHSPSEFLHYAASPRPSIVD
jgi:hypothetical protein